MVPLTLDDWVNAARNEFDKNNHHANYHFEKSNSIIPPDLEDLFDRWIGGNVDECSDAHEVLERFLRCHGFAKLAGAAVDPGRHGPRLFCVKSWRTVYWIVQEEEVPVRTSEGAAIEQTLRSIYELLTRPHRDPETELALAEMERGLCADLSALLSPAPAAPEPSPEECPAQSPAAPLRRHFKKAAPARQNPHRSPAIPTASEIEVTWVGPYRSLVNALGDDLTKPATPRDELLARVVNVMGLLVYDRAEWDARLVFIFDPGSFEEGELRRPTLFSGGFPECYASAHHPDDGWGRTARLDDGSANACGDGVPEAVCHGNILKRAGTLHYVGLLTPAMYAKAGRPNPSLVARNRFQHGATSAHSGP